MPKIATAITLALIATGSSALTHAQPAGDAGANEGQAAPAPQSSQRNRVSLQDLLENVRSSPRREYLLDPRAQSVFVGGTLSDTISYPELLAILRQNGFAAITIEGVVNIVPAQMIRSMPVPIVDPDAEGIPDDEWVTMIITLENAEAGQLIPLIRPLVPVEGHMAAHLPRSTIVLVDRFANAKRIVRILRELD